ncbi:plasmid recombination enzyme family protein, partial [Klebsiella pneumoniae]|nr:plasmid recombination enzyme family protein [Klebsiella pneumoniae]
NMTLKNENISLKNDVSVLEMLKRILPKELSSLIKKAKDITTYKPLTKNELSNRIAEQSKLDDISSQNENTIGKGLKLK